LSTHPSLPYTRCGSYRSRVVNAVGHRCPLLVASSAYSRRYPHSPCPPFAPRAPCPQIGIAIVNAGLTSVAASASSSPAPLGKLVEIDAEHDDDADDDRLVIRVDVVDRQ